jgi:hypothetical protein
MAAMCDDVASRVVVSHPADLGEWERDELAGDTYRAFLHRVYDGPVSVGDEWDEWVSCGCALPTDVLFRVERVEGGAALGPETDIAYVER